VAISSAAFSGCGKTRNESFRRAGFARGICFFLDLAKKSRSLASLGMTKRYFFRSLFSLRGFGLAKTKTRGLKPALQETQRAGSGWRGGVLPPGVGSSAVLLNMAKVM